MPAITSRGAIVAYQIGLTQWGTPVAVGANTQLLISAGLPLHEPREFIPDPSIGYAWNKYFDLGKKNISFDLTMPLRYSGRMWSLIAQCVGLDTVTGSSDPYTHTITLRDSVDGLNLFGTLGVMLGPSGGELRFGWPSIKPVGFTITGPNGQGFIDLTVKLIGTNVRIQEDETTHTVQAFGNVTHITLNSTLPPMIPFGALRFRMNSQSGSALASGDTIKIRKFTFNFERNMSQEWVSKASTTSAWETDEPIEEGIPKQELTIEIPDLNAVTYLENFQDKAEKKADIYFSLDSNHDLLIQFPRLVIDNPEATLGEGRIPQTIKLVPFLASNAPNGMTCTNWQIVLRDAFSTSYTG